ncbi:MAG TPA: zinc ribbon domain-containing protein [Tepidisphaeraceae bacterium]|jgi:predicted RNA-binding Zn-ribbon protein involved in translation (DUF1610 family)|nr:zinc ribbon domain-containing protein [Tepidisphaeraceae bacterium]
MTHSFKPVVHKMILILCVVIFLATGWAWFRSTLFNDGLRWTNQGIGYGFNTFLGGMNFTREVINTPPEPLEWHHYQYGVQANGGGIWAPEHHDWSMGGFGVKHEQYLHTMGSWGDKYLQPIPLNDPRYAGNPDFVDYRTLSLPFWCVALLPAMYLLRDGWRRFVIPRKCRRLAARGLCPHCGYDLRAATDLCPECGARVVIVRVPEPAE